MNKTNMATGAVDFGGFVTADMVTLPDGRMVNRRTFLELRGDIPGGSMMGDGCPAMSIKKVAQH
jgi:hypothetical protein